MTRRTALGELAPIYAQQGSAYFLSANEGDDPSLDDPYHVMGESQAIDPFGRVTAMLRESHRGVLLARVDRTLLETARRDPRTNVAIWVEPGAYAAP